MSNSVQLDLYVEADVLTAGCCREIVNSIFESLLYQRNQIPFVYKTYRYYVSKWLEDDEKSDLGTMSVGVNFHLQRQRDRAKLTQKTISSMKETINQTFATRSVKCLRFLFGGTAFTPKEAYTIHLPTKNILVNHSYDHHRISPAKINEALISLLTSEGLYSIFSNNLNPTNVYLEFELHDLPKTLPNSNSNPTLFSKDFFVAPPSCKDIHIHLVHKPTANFDKRQLKCCKELQIFEDIISFNLGKVEAGRDAETKDGVPVSMVGENVAWWESETVVRGFKEQAVKGCNMWS